ncbi:carbamoyltransferase HypF [Bradyrhizobium sp.]|uniref:carbamoyltransferase HypF n=1 Tax=Bradyrhizobium sp. TaxID=376 RepID=UPI003C481933
MTVAQHSIPSTPRLRVRVRGTVQGVGFRPYVYGLARRYELGGFVCNDADGVLIEIEGARVPEFVRALRREAPPLARIDAVETETAAASGDTHFAIAASGEGPATTPIAADAATCERCLDDLFDPSSRFHLYPFVNCTDCGPRYTLTRRLPYDRLNTSMAAFSMCADCAGDYRSPGNRRFHAEPIACPNCGPKLSHGIDDIVAALVGGKIVAVKSLGGFQLLCDARNEQAVASLRARKNRDAKPFAVMVASIASVDGIADSDAIERQLLGSIERPIVLLKSRSALAASVAPGLAHLGVMLPYTPLHHLLFHAVFGKPDKRAWQDEACDLVLVATSANPGGEPLVIDDDDAQRRLAGIADLIVTHDRAIVVRADDSVAVVIDGAPALIRRARGYAPRPIRLARDVPSVLAVGGHLKATVTVTRGREAFVSQHIGDLGSADSIRYFEQTVAHLLDILDVEPVAVAHDRHPDYASTRFAEAQRWPALAIQHHHAHVAAIAAENGVEGPLLGLVLDGFGYGENGANWGGELLLCDDASFTRVGHLSPLPMPGGDIAAREPWRMAAAALHALGRDDEIAGRFAGHRYAGQITQLLRQQSATPATTSAGRLFDAVAGLLGTSVVQHYEGQAAMELEARVRRVRVDRAGWTIDNGAVSFLPLLELLASPGFDATVGAELFHGSFAAAMVDLVTRAANAHGLGAVALGGGCFLNRVLAKEMRAGLLAAGIEPLTARAVPPNDAGLSLGQAWVAAGILNQQHVRASGALIGSRPECV